MTRPVQPDLLDALTRAVVEEITAADATAPFEFTGTELGRIGSLDDVPGWLRFPDEPGYVELDQNMMPVTK